MLRLLISVPRIMHFFNFLLYIYIYYLLYIINVLPQKLHGVQSLNILSNALITLKVNSSLIDFANNESGDKI